MSTPYLPLGLLLLASALLQIAMMLLLFSINRNLERMVKQDYLALILKVILESKNGQNRDRDR